MNATNTQHALSEAQELIQSDLQTALNHFDIPSPLKEAVHHAVMLGGKRVRPALCYATAKLKKEVIPPAARRAAVAVEFIHCYSLVHDDLPCMDNDELRRGQPTCHVAFGESTALLAGDILQSMAFEILGSRLFETADVPNPEVSLRQMQILATASSKMVCGQVLDLESEGKTVDLDQLEKIHLNKTGALIQSAIMMGATAVYPANDVAFSVLRQFGQALGLAFQVQDDVLDVTADTAQLGKTAGKDVQAEKSTYPALMGLEDAKQYAEELHEEAAEALGLLKLQGDTTHLSAIIDFLLHRQS